MQAARSRLRFMPFLIIFALALATAATATGQTEVVLHDFGSGSDGQYPYAGLVADKYGNLYGTTGYGGASGHGIVFELKPMEDGGYSEEILHNFACNTTDGCYPYSGLAIDASGNLYGMTESGGSHSGGIVFEIELTGDGGRAEKVLHNFDNNGDGFDPEFNSLTFDSAGNLYGTTQYGGANNQGTVFELESKAGGWNEKVLYSFGSSGTDGTIPRATLLIDSSGNLYGTTGGGGANGPYGTVWELSRAGDAWTETILYSFCALSDCADGATPGSTLVMDGAGNLYGVTASGGAYKVGYDYGGTVFQLSPTVSGSWQETVLHNFGSGTDGFSPDAGPIFDSSGNLYGTTQYGGLYSSDGGAVSYGTAYELSPASGGSWTENVLVNFGPKDSGTIPFDSLLLGSGGVLYGTTSGGGTSEGGNEGRGTAFKITP